MAVRPYRTRISGDRRNRSALIEEIAMMFHSPETLYAYVKQQQRELIAEAERTRVLSAARRARRARRDADTASHAAGRAGPSSRAAIAA
jgi:IS30 family transposase